MAVAAWLDYKTPYKNVICLGHINDKYGKKMSKSKGNVVDPWTIANRYGIDALRWYFYSINDPGEPKNFDEDEVAKVLRKFSLTLYNSFAFLALYGKRGVNIRKEPKPSNVLDEWILAKLREVVSKVAQRMDDYDFPSSARLIEGFIDDLSRWFIRRSRKRFQKVSNKSDWEKASAVLGYCLLQFSKVIAPFVPFFAEALYQSLKKICSFDWKDSVHLESWPQVKTSKKDALLFEAMDKVRNYASLVLAKRAEVGIKVRQPLAKLSIKNNLLSSKKLEKELFDVLKEEINVKEIVIDRNLSSDFELDTNITPELRVEGILRELVRTIQDLRQDAGYVPKDKIELSVASSAEIEALVRNYQSQLAKDVNAKKVLIGKTQKFDAEIETKIDDSKVWVAIRKI
jgi:isoleucyl-tRNA synthetase